MSTSSRSVGQGVDGDGRDGAEGGVAGGEDGVAVVDVELAEEACQVGHADEAGK